MMVSRQFTAVAAFLLLFAHVAGAAGYCSLCAADDASMSCAQKSTRETGPAFAPSCCCEISCAETEATEAVLPEVPLSTLSPIALAPDGCSSLVPARLYRPAPVATTPVALPVQALYKLTHSYLL